MTSYNQLKQDLIDLTENNSSGFSTESNQFIDTAERRLARELINVPELYKHQSIMQIGTMIFILLLPLLAQHFLLN